MKRFLKKHAPKIRGVISCFDRLLFKGYLPIGWAGAMEHFMHQQGLLVKDFKRFVQQASDCVKEHAKGIAHKARRPYIHLTGPIRKEQKAREIATRDGITKGLICVFAAVEACQSFKMVYGEGRPRLINARRKCLCLYFYFIDRELGFMHLRLQSWFPFTVQVCLNGHDWLARKLHDRGIPFQQRDNAFLNIGDFAKAQSFAHRFARKNWPRILSAFARRANPLMNDLLKGKTYYWITEQAEFATDVLFKNPASLTPLYEKLARHATVCFGAEDVLTFLGRKLHGNFQGEVLTHYKKRWPGLRVKHTIQHNGIKMYDKHGCVLRVETVINRPYPFKVRRWGKRGGRLVLGWFPMAKRVSNLPRYAEVSFAANQRYLDALAVIEDPSAARESLRRLTQPLRHNGRSYRGFNPASEDDLRLFAALLRGEHILSGLRNRDLRCHLFAPSTQPSDLRRHSAAVSRVLKRLHLRNLIAKIPRSRRWRLSPLGHTVLSSALTLYHEIYPQTFMKQAA